MKIKAHKSKSNQTREECLQLAKQTPGLVRSIRSSPSLFFFIAPIVLLLIRCCSPFPVVEAQISPLGCCAPARNALLPVLPYNLENLPQVFRTIQGLDHLHSIYLSAEKVS